VFRDRAPAQPDNPLFAAISYNSTTGATLQWDTVGLAWV